ncbi:PD-(D/E)XK nuclease family protein [Bifidobacterium felsineum]|uniref:PD-(D/E)XK nuclease family protein n=1 Tax=Bifidobacterium felsineum TaxID=2045440 RepID=UPI001BDCC732|nr:PD-(D/E)XK nuclease family protein [Bifidobacterium felsineum]MBT1164438.1 PD-(D/E)XK nuclease family protein [Bifidobacterium felsineum]
MSEPVKTIEPVSLAMTMLSDLDFLEANSLLHKPNMFDMVGMSRQEIRHSAFLAWLLEPSNPHGLDDLFIRRLLAELYKAHPEGFASFAVKDLSNLAVEREVTTGAKKGVLTYFVMTVMNVWCSVLRTRLTLNYMTGSWIIITIM